MQGRRCDGGDGRREVEYSGRSGRPGHPAVRGVRRIPNSSSLHSPTSQSRVLSNIRRRRRTAVYRTSSSAQRPSALESQDSKLSPARHGPGSDASVGTARHQRRLRQRDQLRGRGRGRVRPLAAVSTVPVPAEEVSGDSLHRRLRRGRAPGGRTILRRAGMRRGGGPLGVPVAAPRDHDPDARTDGSTHQRRDSELVQRWRGGLNAPTGAWCSLTGLSASFLLRALVVSMHLQVRGAP